VWNVGRGTDSFLLSTIEKLATTMIDMPLDHRVLTALEQNPHIARRNLRFETEQGRVTLRGVVGTYYQKQMAQEAVRRVEGVREIANELEVCWG
jgi:osmotically-inducible protein OsmY